MRFAVEAWAPEYGAPLHTGVLAASPATVDTDAELPAARWRPLDPAGDAPRRLAFVDGVRRVDARLWIDDGAGASLPGIAAVYAAGVATCDGAAAVSGCEVRRGLFSAAPTLTAVVTRHGEYTCQEAAGDGVEPLLARLQQRMGELEALVASRAAGVDLLVVDGPLDRVLRVSRAVGYVKTHHTTYLPPALSTVVADLRPGQRTPLFTTSAAQWSRYSWYARLPGGEGHPWAGVYRGEVSGDRPPDEARRLADAAAAALPRFASVAHKDPRAPQNLHPIAALERALRRHLGDPALAYRSLRLAAGAITA